jgi:hypothetical protein
MTARKTRPQKGALVTPDMSVRDVAAALGVSKSELQRWRALGELPTEVFERRLAEQLQHGDKHRVTAASILRGERVPPRGRVERAMGLFTTMNETERASFLVWVAGVVEVSRDTGGIRAGKKWEALGGECASRR